MSLRRRRPARNCRKACRRRRSFPTPFGPVERAVAIVCGCRVRDGAVAWTWGPMCGTRRRWRMGLVHHGRTADQAMRGCAFGDGARSGSGLTGGAVADQRQAGGAELIRTARRDRATLWWRRRGLLRGEVVGGLLQLLASPRRAGSGEGRQVHERATARNDANPNSKRAGHANSRMAPTARPRGPPPRPRATCPRSARRPPCRLGARRRPVSETDSPVVVDLNHT